MDDIERTVEEFRAVFPDLPALARSLASRPGALGYRGVAVGVEAPPAATELENLLAEGRRGIEKLRQGREDDLTPPEHQGLEAIIHIEGRPALFIQEGKFFPPPERWSILERHREAIEAAVRRVGRIEVQGHPELDWIGTGFLIAPQIIMTNEHVVREFARGGPEGWAFRPGQSSRFDLREELGGLQPEEFPISEVLEVHDELDLALLRVVRTSHTGSLLPDPLPVAATAPEPLPTREVYVVGYPAWDGRRNDPEVMRRLFSGIYNVKRLQPGWIRDADLPGWTMFHDCSTLGGNSGSPVIDLATHRVVGLHYSGRYLEGNRAIPLWLLRDTPILQGTQIRWE